MNVLFLLTNPAASPGERYRVIQYIPALNRLGVSARVDTLLTDDLYRRLQSSTARVPVAAEIIRAAVERMASLRVLEDIDLAVIYRQPVGLWPGSVEWLLRRNRVPFLFDFDDAIFLPPPSPVSRVSGFLRPPQRVPHLIGEASLTTAGNEYLASFARSHSKHVEVLPTCIDVDRYETREHSQRPTAVIGWIGSRSTAQYLRELDPVWRLIDGLDRYLLRVIGGFYHGPLIHVDERPWALKREAADLAEFDVGVMPLPDDPWTRGKCGLKILQYMAAGIPTVASPVGVNVELIEDGVNGFLASTPEEWAEKITILVEDPDLRNRFAAAGRKTVEESFSLSRWAPRFADMMQAAAA